MKIEFTEASLKVKVPGLSWTAFGPTVEILAGQKEKLVRLIPGGKPVASRPEILRTALGRSREQTWTWRDQAEGHKLGLTFGFLTEREGFTVRASFHNGGKEAIRLRRIVVLDGGNDALVVDGNPADWWLDSAAESRRVGNLAVELPSADEITRKIWAGFNMPVPFQLGLDERKSDGKWRTCRDWMTLFTDEGRRGLAVGPIGEPVADLDISCRVDNGRVRVAISSEMSEIVVDSGETRESQEFAVLWGDYNDSMEALMRAVAISHGARTHRGPAVGWCSWYHSGPGVSASDIYGIAKVADQEKLPLPLIQIDDGFQRQVGNWRTNDRFPEGWAPVIRSIRTAGAMPGIWLAPLAVHESTEIFRNHPDWFQRGAEGELVGEANNWGPRSRWIDPTHPEARLWIENLMREFRSFGFEYFKIDFNNVGDGVRFHDPKKTKFQVLRDLYRLYRETIGEESYLLGCLGMQRAVCGFADAVRIGPDSCAIWRAAHPCTIEECIRSVTISSLANGILWANDPDVAYTRERGGLNEDEVRTWAGHVALLGGAVFTSEPFHTHDADIGTVVLKRKGSDLAIDADVRDDAPRLEDNPWCGSSVEIFTTSKTGAVHQYFLMPAILGRQASAKILIGGSGKGLQANPSNVSASSESTSGGWRISAIVKGAADHANFAIEAKLNSQIKTAGQDMPADHVESVVFKSAQPFSGTKDYTPLDDGASICGKAKYKGWAGYEDAFARMVPPAPEKARPWRGGWDREGTQIGFIVRRPWGKFAVIQIYNPADGPAEKSLIAEGLEGLGGEVHAWSFWDQRYLGLIEPSALKFKLNAHAPVLLRLTTPYPGLPVLIGSTLHYSMGAAEIADWRATPETLEIRLNSAGSHNGALWIASQGTPSISFSEGADASACMDGNLWKININGRRRGAKQILRISSRSRSPH